LTFPLPPRNTARMIDLDQAACEAMETLEEKGL
jgi:hypothetical protein